MEKSITSSEINNNNNATDSTSAKEFLLTDLPEDLLKLVAIYSMGEPHYNNNNIKSSSMYNLSLVCRGFNKIINSPAVLKKQYFNLMHKEYDYQLENSPSILKNLEKISINADVFLKSKLSFKIQCVYLLNSISLDEIIIHLINLIASYDGEENNYGIYETVITNNLFRDFHPIAIAKRIVEKGYHKLKCSYPCNFLHYFVLTGCTEAVEILINAGVEINQLDNVDMTPLCGVVQAFGLINRNISKTTDLTEKNRLTTIRDKYNEMLKLLIKYQADVDRTQATPDDNEPLPTTLNELFRIYENWISQTLLLDEKAIDLLNEMAAIILCNSSFKDNFEELLQFAPNDEEGDEAALDENIEYCYKLTDGIIGNIKNSMEEYIRNNPSIKIFTFQDCIEECNKRIIRQQCFGSKIKNKPNDSSNPQIGYPFFSNTIENKPSDSSKPKKRKYDEISEHPDTQDSDENNEISKRAKK